MAFETADIFSSLNRILEAQERREQNEQQMAMQGMQFAQNKRQQDLENLYLSQDRFVQSTERAQADMGVILMEQGKNLLSWFEGPLFNEYYNQDDQGRFVFESSKTEKLVKELAKAMGGETKYKSIASTMVSDMQKMYQNPNDYVHAKNLATRLNTHINKDSVRFGLKKMFVVPDAESLKLLENDMNQILSSNKIYNRIIMEKTQTLKGDYAWDEPINIPTGDQGKGDKERVKAQNTAGSKLQQRRAADEILTDDAMELFKDYDNQLRTAAAIGQDAYFEKIAEIHNANVTDTNIGEIEWDPVDRTFIVNKLLDDTGNYDGTNPTASALNQLSGYKDVLSHLDDRADDIASSKARMKNEMENIGITGNYQGSVYQANHLLQDLLLNIENDILVHTQKQFGDKMYSLTAETLVAPYVASTGDDGSSPYAFGTGSSTYTPPLHPRNPTPGFNPIEGAEEGVHNWPRWQGFMKRDYKWEKDLPTVDEWNNMYLNSLISDINKNNK
tara:strand:+ start:1357 stop:2862 length:1506 start_codon:yes stop_codon:yes gene_type:complete